ncbi:MAG: DUF4325 domain-containing protein [Candidatus Paceibacterota bacterium]|jgi:hypothetical protein|nr:STAS-like domain-containing protein [Candidatus Paceibacterota bacterium]
MQTIHLNKFGNVLVSRPAGLEAFNAIRPQLDPNETVQIDFSDVLTVTPSWLDEFLTQLTDFNNGNVILLPTQNASVLAALPVLAEARQDHVATIVKQAMKQQ